MTLADKIKLVRSDFKLTQAEFAEAICANTTRVVSIEASKSLKLTGDEILAIHNAFGIKFEWLLSDDVDVEDDMYVQSIEADPLFIRTLASKLHEISSLIARDIYITETELGIMLYPETQEILNLENEIVEASDNNDITQVKELREKIEFFYTSVSKKIVQKYSINTILKRLEAQLVAKPLKK